MEDANPAHRPYVLWKDSQPNGDTATLLIWPEKDQGNAILRVDE